MEIIEAFLFDLSVFLYYNTFINFFMKETINSTYTIISLDNFLIGDLFSLFNPKKYNEKRN